ncbi:MULTISPECIES: hypothetical protein [Streptomyces]|uniref:Uncharacterized protein n=2 Tax=Streptomyces diastaticus group TaxID=2849069 RepID=A0A8H9HYG7_9ACTN|nr:MULTISPECIES: hypothetical protein [Streptomyces]MDQ0291993.1 hypothetical protein [Streptomyces sp. DSM 41037]QNE84480.1 hypothetical protein F0345_28055 [Streptomyces rutgersensis]GFH75840.1 hypothetical protein Sgou_05100 [Streptomyces gougerotii]GGU93773.1 hypothetical protein GCM10010227_56140 [Streptomyces gougerotii]
MHLDKYPRPTLLRSHLSRHALVDESRGRYPVYAEQGIYTMNGWGAFRYGCGFFGIGSGSGILVIALGASFLDPGVARDAAGLVGILLGLFGLIGGVAGAVIAEGRRNRDVKIISEIPGAGFALQSGRRPVFLWFGILGLVLLGLSLTGTHLSTRDPQIDLKVVREELDGRCDVAWSAPWDGELRKSAFQCDPNRDPILSDWETAFVVSYGPRKGELYQGGEVHPSSRGEFIAGAAGLSVIGLSMCGGGWRMIVRAGQRQGR